MATEKGIAHGMFDAREVSDTKEPSLSKNQLVFFTAAVCYKIAVKP